MTSRADVTYLSFPARCTSEGPDVRTRAWMRARYNGFLQAMPDDDQLPAVALSWASEGRTLHAVYDDGPRPRGALEQDVPVATLATYEATLDAGLRPGIPCILIADVTVRPTHQGRGLMRLLMEAAVEQAEGLDIPLMALHAAHPARYARFGFAPALRAASVEVDCGRFRLRSATSGTVHEGDPDRAQTLASHLESSGSVFSFGALTPVRPATHEPSGPEEGLRSLVHVDGAGRVDGVLTYLFEGWTPNESVIQVRSETYCALDAHAALWQTLCSTGIATTVKATDVRPDDPLPWMSSDRAAWRVTGLTDGYSLRVLDPARALAMRGYAGSEGSLVVQVSNESGGPAGTWRLSVSGRQATVEAASSPADVTMEATALAAVFLGGTSARTLLDAGLVSATQDAADELDALLRPPLSALSRLRF